MRLATLIGWLRSGELPLLLRTGRLVAPVYRANFLAAAARSGLLRLLAAGPAPAARIAKELGIPEDGTGALEEWLAVGVRLRELARGPQGYALRGRLAKSFARPERDAVLAFLEEGVSLHPRLLAEAPALLRAGRTLTLADQEGEMIARSSRILEPVVREAIDEALPERGALRLLEVGCGSGVHVRYAAERNPELSALCLELQPAVAERARENLRAWGLAARAEVRTGDVRGLEPRPEFDLVTLHNNVYYFRVEDRVALLATMRRWLRPGGRILLTTACRGGALGAQLLSLWGALTEGCGRLPDPTELVAQLVGAGFHDASARKLAPDGSFQRFLAAA
jgi:SAM-dependent methyltransferase